MSAQDAVLTGLPAGRGERPVERWRRLLRALWAPRNHGPILYRLLLWSCRNSRAEPPPLLSGPSGRLNRLHAWIFRDRWRARRLYPVLRAGRNLTLRLLRRQPLDSHDHARQEDLRNG